MQTKKRGIIRFLTAIAALGFAPFAFADELSAGDTAWMLTATVLVPVEIGAVPASVDRDAERAQWIERLSEAQNRLETARARHDEAAAAYRDQRQRHARGDARKEATLELEAAKAELAEAERSWVELKETARRAGVPPGWVRGVEKNQPAAPEP